MDDDRESAWTQRTYVRRDVELGSWEVTERHLAPELRGLVTTCRAYAQHELTPSSHRTMPMPGVPLVITLGPSHVIRERSGRCVTRGSFVAGPHEQDVVVEADGFVGLQADLTPLGAHRLLGGGLHELAGEVVELEDVVGVSAARRLVEALGEEPDPGRRVARLEAALRARLPDAPSACPQVTWAVERLTVTGGAIAVGALAAELGWSRRHLARRFREQAGMPPKRLARLIRFHRAVGLLERPDGPGLAEVAHRAGYYDQAHLANDVRDLCGLTPAQVRARVVTAPPCP